MKMHTPSRWTFLVSLILVALAVLSHFVRIPYVTQNALWVSVIGYVVLVIGCHFKTE